MDDGKDRDFPVFSSALDAEALVGEVRKRARRRREEGAWKGPDPGTVAFPDWEKEMSEEDFLRYHLQVVERLSDVNYGDFEIVSRGGLLGRLEVMVKKVIWKLLRFYTYRLFSQQREFDCQVTEALQSHYRWSRAEIDRLAGEVESLRRRLEESGRHGGG